MGRLSPKELADAITDFVNTYGHDNNEFIQELLTRQHRTLQQSTIRLFLEVIEAAAQEDYRTDGRNEGSKKVCQEIIAGFKEIKKKGYMAEGVTEERADKYLEGSKPSKYLGHI